MKDITDIARPLYTDVGQNSWEHISQVLARGDEIAQAQFGRPLTDVERATLLFHDCAVKARQSKDDHAKYSAQMARKLLARHFKRKQLQEIATAIEEHDDDSYSSPTSELLAAADFNPPDLPWMANKCYVWGIKHGLTPEQRYTHATRFLKSNYGRGGLKTYPKLYMNTYRKRIQKLQDAIAKLTPEDCQRIIERYRQQRGWSENDIALG